MSAAATLLKALKLIGGPLQVSGQRGLRHIETGEGHSWGQGEHIASGKNEALLNAICDVVNAALAEQAGNVAASLGETSPSHSAPGPDQQGGGAT